MSNHRGDVPYDRVKKALVYAWCSGNLFGIAIGFLLGLWLA